MTKHFLSAAVAAGVLISTAGYAADTAAPAAPSQKAVEITTTVCQNCHGPHGDSVSSTFPRLNAQQPDYIAAQIKNFRSHDRADPHAQAYMWGMASQIDDDLARQIGDYYAAQAPTQSQTGGALAAQGKAIFFNGVPDHHVPPCAACHGDHGEGSADVPRLAGQHADYLKRQLEDFRSLMRTNDVMHANTKDMTDSEIEAVVSYLAND